VLMNAAVTCRPDARVLKRISELLEKRILPLRPD
jgi:hypothetical protein